MKLLILLCVMAVVSITTCSPEDYSRFDHIDIDEILANDRIFKAYIHCFLDKGKCTPEAADLKRSFPKVIKNKCEGCTGVEKIKLAKVMKVLRDKDATDFNSLIDKYFTNNNVMYIEEFIQEYAP